MQFIVISHQLLEMLWALILGIVFGVVYDCIRFLRRLLLPLRCEVLFANVFDFIYFIFAGTAYSIFLYAASFGRFRWFTFLALICGFMVYRLLPGRLIKVSLYFIADKINCFLYYACLPLRMLWRLIQKGSAFSFGYISRVGRVIKTKKLKRQLYKDVRL